MLLTDLSQFFILLSTKMLTSTILELLSCCAMLYHMLNGQLFLQPKPVPHSEQYVSIIKTLSLPRACTSQRTHNPVTMAAMAI